MPQCYLPVGITESCTGHVYARVEYVEAALSRLLNPSGASRNEKLDSHYCVYNYTGHTGLHIYVVRGLVHTGAPLHSSGKDRP